MSVLDVLGVDNTLLAVGDFDTAMDFYGRKLGLPLKFQLADRGVAGFRLGSEEPGLFVRVQGLKRQEPDESSPRLWLEVADARAASDELRSRGVQTLGEPFEIPTGWTVELADPWGNVIGLTDYKKAPDRGRRVR